MNRRTDRGEIPRGLIYVHLGFQGTEIAIMVEKTVFEEIWLRIFATLMQNTVLRFKCLQTPNRINKYIFLSKMNT
jgi:hypothetical protein